MAETKVTFGDGAAYERLMGRWSRAVGSKFLAWLAPPAGASWLDVGCGTGAFTQLVFDTCSPKAIAGVDPAPAQIEHARQQPVGWHADFRVADAMELPFPAAAFDLVVSALVLNFIPDRDRALHEMRRVTRSGGNVAGYLWDRSKTTEHSPTWPMQRGLANIGAEVARPLVVPEGTIDGLNATLGRAGLAAIDIMPIDVSQTYRDFEDYWEAQTPSFHPTGKIIAAMPAADRDRLREELRALLPASPDGSISFSSRANAFRTRAPQ